MGRIQIGISTVAFCALSMTARAQVAGFQGNGELRYYSAMGGSSSGGGPAAFDPNWYNTSASSITKYLSLTGSASIPPAREFAAMSLAGVVEYDSPTNTAAVGFNLPLTTELTQLDPGHAFGPTRLEMEFQVDTLVGPSGLNVSNSALNLFVTSSAGLISRAEVRLNFEYFLYNTVTGASTALGVQQFAIFTSGFGPISQVVNMAPAFAGTVYVPFVAGGIGGASEWVFRSKGLMDMQVSNEDAEASIRIIPQPGALSLLGFGGFAAARRRR